MGRVDSVVLKLMDLESLATFLVVVEAGSMEVAAHLLATARAIIDARLAALEELAGEPLLVHEGDRARPTEVGRMLARRGERILHDATALTERLGPRGEVLRLTLPTSLPAMGMARLFNLLGLLWPTVRFEVRVSDDPCAGLGADPQLALCVGAAPPGPWSVVPLAVLRERLFASRAYLAAHGRPQSVEDLQGRGVFRWFAGEGAASFLPTTDGRYVKVVLRLVSDDAALVRTMATIGAGLAYAPAEGLPDGLDLADQLEVVLPDEVGRSVPLNLVVPEAVEQLPRVRAFREAIAEMPWQSPSLAR